MSEFDREAEKAKLREQLEADDEKRAESQRMSELLLQGATMTNKHCDACGNPIFRYQGQEFCPVCADEDQSTSDDTAPVPHPGTDLATQPESLPSVPEEYSDPDAPAPSGDAAEALERAIVKLAERAANTPDSRRAKEYMAAAKEAAETLRTLPVQKE